MTSLAPISSEPFALPAPGSVWDRCIFTPTYDPLSVIETAFWVQTKSARVVPFNLFQTQRAFMARMGLQNIEVKPRQVGSSTLKLGLMTACSVTTPNLNSLVVTHREDATATMRETIIKFIERLNTMSGMNIRIGTNNADELELPDLNCHFYFGSSKAPGIGRSKTIHMLLASELAHWEGQDPGAELAAMTESVPDRGIVFVESTPNGATGPFYNLYADRGNGMVKHFFPWFLEPSRRLPLQGRTLHLTPEELRLVTMHRLDHEQIAWRRWKWRQLEAKNLYFLQEYPEDDVSCFLAGVRSAFNASRMIEYLRYAEVAPFSSVPVPGKPTDPGGELIVWEEPRTGGIYVVACDVGGGHANGDLSYAVVRNARSGEHAASLRGHWDPSSFSAETIALATRYNLALLSHETTGLGSEAARYAVDQGYPNYRYEERGVDWDLQQIRPPNPHRMMPGFNVTAAVRSRMMARVLDEVSQGSFRSRDSELIRQMTSAQIVRRQIGHRVMDVILLPKHMNDDALMAYGQSCLLLEEPVVAQESRPQPRRGM